MREILGDRLLVSLISAQVTSALGEKSLFLVLAIWIKDMTGSTAQAAFIFVVTGLGLVVGPALGVVIDRVNRKRLVVTCSLSMPIVLTSLLAVPELLPHAWVYVVAALYGGVSHLIGSTHAALMKDHCRTDLLPAANGLYRSAKSTIDIAAPVMGAGLYAVAGLQFAIYFDVATFLIAAAFVARIPARRPDDESRDPVSSIGSDMVSGIRHLARDPLLCRLSCAIVGMFLLTGILPSAYFEVAVQGLDRDVSFVGVLTAISGAGGVVGGVLTSRLASSRSYRSLSGVSLMGYGLAFFLVVTEEVALVATGFLLSGFWGAVFVVTFWTAAQAHTPAALMGRVAASASTFVGVPQVFSVAVGALLVTTYGYRPSVLAMSVGLVIVGGLLFHEVTPAETRVVSTRTEMRDV